MKKLKDSPVKIYLRHHLRNSPTNLWTGLLLCGSEILINLMINNEKT